MSRSSQTTHHGAIALEDPSWIGKYARTEETFPAAEILACRNELVHLPGYVSGAAEQLISPTPCFFSLRCLTYDFDPAAPVPDLLVKYLERAFPDCPESRELAAEWAGYLLLPDTSHQKLMMLYGVSGAGKGVYVDLIRAILGAGNSATATLGSMGESLGLAGFIGKSLATIDDARLGGKNERGALLERLLTISGRGCIAVNRKGSAYWEGKLPTRLMLATNLLPELRDPSEALIRRLLVLKFNQEFRGEEEDPGLAGKLTTPANLPGLLNWAIGGYARLRGRKHFHQANGGLEAIEQMRAIQAPLRLFVADRCVLGPDQVTRGAALYQAYVEYAKKTGQTTILSNNSFGRDLAATFRDIKHLQRPPEPGARKIWVYQGIGLANGAGG